MPVRKQSKVVKCIRKKIEDVMHEYKIHSLKRRNNKPVKSRKEAIAIALSVSKQKCTRKTSKKISRKTSRKTSKKSSKKN
jgi:hypothetical protein